MTKERRIDRSGFTRLLLAVLFLISSAQLLAKGGVVLSKGDQVKNILPAFNQSVLTDTAPLNSGNMDSLGEISEARMHVVINTKYDDRVCGFLTSSDDTYLLVEDCIDSTLHLFDRSDLVLVRVNTDVNLGSVFKHGAKQMLRDQIVLQSGDKIDCLVLDIAENTIQYFTGAGLKREVLPANSISMIHLKDDSLTIPFQNTYRNSINI